MKQSGFIVAIDLGSSKITGVVGRINENNVISIIASETIPSNRCIRRGMVYNIEETASKVRKLINLLENKLDRRIGKVYVSISGQSLHSIDYRERRQLSSSGVVTENIINQLKEAAEKFKPDMSRNYGIADVEYFIDDKPEREPVGVTCSVIEANFKIITGRPNLVSNIEKSIKEKLNIQIAGYYIGVLASAAIALNEDEKELGCVFLDFGAGTTTVSVYKGGILRRMVEIPFGGKNLTSDICELNFTENDAEQYKVKFGKARENVDNSLLSPFSSKPTIDLVELNKVIVMRLDEITANIKEQIKLSSYEGQLGAGIVITGGASQLKNLDIYLTEKLKMPVRRASAKKTFINNSPELANDPSFTQALGLLMSGTEDCELYEVKNEEDELFVENQKITPRVNEKKEKKREEKKREERRVKKNTAGGFKDAIGGFLSGMFSEDDDE